MAIKGSSPPAKTTIVRSSEEEITVEEFREWLKSFDADRDGRISRDELRRAIRSIRLRFSGLKSKRGIRYADADGDGFIDDAEIERLADFAQKSLGLKIVSY